tara:strand:+ start:16 stop:225 length:210 start_codon:yes stop_codon:yes gene_type:complete
LSGFLFGGPKRPYFELYIKKKLQYWLFNLKGSRVVIRWCTDIEPLNPATPTFFLFIFATVFFIIINLAS